MPPQAFFKGTTRAGRELRLYYEHTAFETYETEDGPYDNPTETVTTGTLDGVPIEVYGVTKAGGGMTVRTDEGTFTAVPEDADADHTEVLRAHLEWKSSDGYEVTVVAKAQDPEGTRFTVKITNGHLIEQADFILTPQVMQTLARGADAPTDEQVARQIAQTARSDKWERIKARAESPTTLMWLAHPS